MIARSKRYRFIKGDIEFETPLLVPSLSSGALGRILSEDPPGSINPVICSIVHSEALLHTIDWALLVSAYDVFHGYLQDAELFQKGFARSRYAQPAVLIIDSGWYEKAGGPFGGIFIEDQDAPQEWEYQHFEKTIDGLDQGVHALVVSWDHVGPYAEQIGRAQEFFGARPRLASLMLLKRPSDGSRFHALKSFAGEDLENLGSFDVIGVTEREMGETIVDRLFFLAQLRRALDDADVPAPIHVFGGLDPLLTPLYFAAGAEIFDGLAWLRYAFLDGVAVKREAAAILAGQIDKREQFLLHTVSLDNLDAIRILRENLVKFVDQDGDWDTVGSQGAFLKPIYESLISRLRKRGNGK